MTIYTLSSSLPDDSFTDWTDPSLWEGGQAPDDPSAQVFLNSAGANFYFPEVEQGEQISIGSLVMQSNNLLLYGSLASAGSVTVGAASGIQIYGGALSAQSLHLNGTGTVDVGIVGVGAVTVAGPVYNDSSIISGNATGLSDQTVLTVSAAYFQNSGLLEASVNSTLLVRITHPGGLANYVSGTLVGGTYEAEAGGVLDLQTSGLIYSDSADLIYDGQGGSVIASYDPSAGQYVPLQQTLSLITQSGILELDAGSYTTAGTLTVAGDLKLLGDAVFSAGTLYVTGGGHLDLILAVPQGGQEVSAGRVINQGAIFADGSGGGTTTIDSAIQGSGTLTIGPSVTVLNEAMQPITTTATIELTKAVSNTIQFSDGTGTVILDSPAAMSGHFQGFQTGDKIELPTIALSAVTSYSYANGILTLQEGSTALHLAFSGGYSTADFGLEAGANGAGTILIGLAPAPASV